jgi:4-aminobutyrate aminotransferase / (S)-3-amino-2-methylpropionate transaminase / 5-aminovalerate transaminase
MAYFRKLKNGLTLMHTQADHCAQLELLQFACFPTLDDDQRFKAKHCRKHIEIFPEGQFVVLDGDRVIGSTSTIRLDFDFEHVNHTFDEVIQGGYLTSHQPQGAWLYGADIGTHPDYRGRGIAGALYEARQEAVWRLGLKGQVTAGMLPGYDKYRKQYTVPEYYERVVSGAIFDPTVGMQIKAGFEPRGLLANYLNDPVCDNYSVLLVLPAEKQVRNASREAAMSYIHLETEVPGPKAKEVLARRASAFPSGWAKATDVVVERAQGSLIFDVDGNTLIDMAGGIGMLAVGHSPASVVKAITQQAAKYIHPCALVTTYEPMVRVAEILNEVTPGKHAKKTLLANSGAEGVENAVKLSRKFTGRQTVICFEGAYHGRTLLTLSLTSKYGLFKKGYGPFAPEIVRLPFPNLYRTPEGMTQEEYLAYSIKQLDHALIAQVDPSAVAAILIEPVQGEAGFIPVPAPFLRRLRELCDQHGIVLIADEVQCGMGRTGRLFACEHYDVVPDIIVTAKALGAGMPIAAITGRAEIMDCAHPGGIGGTYGGSPVACAAAIAALDILRDENFQAHSNELAAVMRDEMESWKKQYPIVGDVRGLGPMLLVEFVADRETRTPLDAPEVLAIVRNAAARGVILMRAGLYSNCIRFLPPLNMPLDMAREALAIVGKSIEAVCETHLATASAGAR